MTEQYRLKQFLLNMDYDMPIEIGTNYYAALQACEELSDKETTYSINNIGKGKVLILKEHNEGLDKAVWTMAAIFTAIAVTAGLIIGGVLS